MPFARRLVALTVLVVTLLATTPSARTQTLSVVQIAASLHVLVLLSDGTVVAAGENRSGQAGRPKQIRRFEPPARIELPGKVVQVAADDADASYAVLEDGTVWAWGNGYKRNLGAVLTGDTDRHTPMPVAGLTEVARVVASNAGVMAIGRDGNVRAWGALPASLTGGTLVYPGSAMPVSVRGLSEITDIVGGPSGGMALRRDGRLVTWTSDNEFRLGDVPGLSNVVSIAGAGGAYAAVTTDGRVWTWGSNEQGALGNGQRGDVGDPAQKAPQPVAGIADAIEVKGGSFGRHLIVRRKNGTLIGWGNSDWGQLGAGVSGFPQPAPRPIKLADVDAYWLGGNYSFARTKDGALWFWGEETIARGMLGLRGNQRLPVRMPIETIVK